MCLLTGLDDLTDALAGAPVLEAYALEDEEDGPGVGRIGFAGGPDSMTGHKNVGSSVSSDEQ